MCFKLEKYCVDVPEVRLKEAPRLCTLVLFLQFPTEPNFVYVCVVEITQYCFDLICLGIPFCSPLQQKYSQFNFHKSLQILVKL
jgi:hypothetical protein